jgi:hypothetical protein
MGVPRIAFWRTALLGAFALVLGACDDAPPLASNGSFALALVNAEVPGYPQATTFTYTFDCGDVAGYGSAAPSATAHAEGGAPRSTLLSD